MSQPQTLVIVRHGETEWNRIAKAVRTGQMPMPENMKGVANPNTKLSQFGKEQSIATGKRLAKLHRDIERVYYSPWVRATQTKELILQQFPERLRNNLEASSLPSLFIREQEAGELDMGSGDHEKANKLYQEYRLMARQKGHFSLTHGGIESWGSVGNRVNLFVQRLKRSSRYNDRKLLIVTHGIVLLMFRFVLENLTEYEVERIHDDDHPKNCSVYTYEWYPTGDRYVLIGCNETYYKNGLRKL